MPEIVESFETIAQATNANLTGFVNKYVWVGSYNRTGFGGGFFRVVAQGSAGTADGGLVIAGANADLERYDIGMGLSPYDFGAYGDYDDDNNTGTDDYDAFAALLAATADRNLRNVDIPSGRYLVDGSLDVESFNTRITGNGSQIYFRHATGYAMRIFRSGCEVNDLGLIATPERQAALWNGESVPVQSVDATSLTLTIVGHTYTDRDVVRASASEGGLNQDEQLVVEVIDADTIRLHYSNEFVRPQTEASATASASGSLIDFAEPNAFANLRCEPGDTVIVFAPASIAGAYTYAGGDGQTLTITETLPASVLNETVTFSVYRQPVYVSGSVSQLSFDRYNIYQHGLVLEPEDVAGAQISNVRVISVGSNGHLGCGIVLIGAGCRIANCSASAVGMHGLALDTGNLTNRQNREFEGWNVVDTFRASGCGGHSIAVGHPDNTSGEIPYRIWIRNADDSGSATDPLFRYVPQNDFCLGDGVKWELSVSSNGVFLCGRNVTLMQQRSIGGTSIARVGNTPYNIANDITIERPLAVGGEAPYDPAILLDADISTINGVIIKSIANANIETIVSPEDESRVSWLETNGIVQAAKVLEVRSLRINEVALGDAARASWTPEMVFSQPNSLVLTPTLQYGRLEVLNQKLTVWCNYAANVSIPGAQPLGALRISGLSSASGENLPPGLDLEWLGTPVFSGPVGQYLGLDTDGTKDEYIVAVSNGTNEFSLKRGFVSGVNENLVNGNALSDGVEVRIAFTMVIPLFA